MSLGLKGRAAQPPTWKGAVSGAVWPRVEVRLALKASGLQLVGLRVKSGRETLTATERTSTGMPVQDLGQGVGDRAALGGVRSRREGPI